MKVYKTTKRRRQLSQRYRIKNKEKTLAYGKNYRKRNEESVKENNKEWRNKNKDKLVAYHKEYRKRNREKRKEYNKKWREKNKNKVKKHEDKYHLNNKEKINRLNKKYNIKKYGISNEELEIIFNNQNCKCAICGDRIDIVTGKYAIDHDHSIGKIRELLCRGCNSGIGFLKEDINILKNAIKYLEKHEA